MPTRAEAARTVVRLAWPVAMRQFGGAFADRTSLMFLGNKTPAVPAWEYDAVGIGKMYSNLTGLSLGVGIGIGITTYVSQSFGNGTHERDVRVHFARCWTVLAVLFVVPVLSCVYAEQILVAAKQPEQVAAAVATFVQVQLVGVPLWWLAWTLQMTMDCLHKPNYGFYCTGGSSVVQILLAWIWVGFYDGGFVDLAWTRVIGGVVAILFMVIMLYRNDDLHLFLPASWRADARSPLLVEEGVTKASSMDGVEEVPLHESPASTAKCSEGTAGPKEGDLAGLQRASDHSHDAEQLPSPPLSPRTNSAEQLAALPFDEEDVAVHGEPHWLGCLKYTGVALPSAVTLWGEWWATEIMGIFAGWLPNAELALGGHAVLFNLKVIVDMTYVGLSTGATAYVGYLVGKEDVASLKQAPAVVLTVAIAFSAATSSALWFLRTPLYAISTSSPAIQDAANEGAPGQVAAAFFYSVMQPAMGICRGVNKQRLAMWLQVGWFSFGLWVSYYLGIENGLGDDLGGLCGIWLGNGIALFLSFIGVATILLTINWDQVIERKRALLGQK